jgi:4-hydroxybenzoate polyprenyltransferase
MATLCIMILNTLGLIPLWGWLGMAVFNILFLYQCIMMIINGCKTLSLKTTVIGCVLFAVIAFARYTDLFVSLLTRSLVFFIAGAALFSVGIYYSKTKKQIEREAI